MAKVINTKKGFKIIEMSFTEAFDICMFGFTENGINRIVCDNCNEQINGNQTVYFIPVLNQAFCKNCFDEWYANAEYFEKDKEYEDDIFNHYHSILKANASID